MCGAPSACSSAPLSLWLYQSTGFAISTGFIGFIAFIRDSDQPPSTSTAPLSSAIASPASDVAAHRSCQRCSRRMSSYKYDKHTLCLHCRDVICSVEVRCTECSSWSTDFMKEYLKHRKSLVSKGKKKPVVTAPSSSSSSVTPSVLPCVSALVSNPSLPSVSDDQKIKDYVHSFLSLFLTQSDS